MQDATGTAASDHDGPGRAATDAEPARRAAVVIHPPKHDDIDGFRATINKAMADHGWAEPLWLETRPDDTGERLAREAVRSGVDLVLASGDGTITACVGGIAGSRVPLGVLPCGTGNLLARNLGLPLSLDEALTVALTGSCRRVDIENCQLGVFCAYATGKGRALIDRELYLPKSWTGDRDRCREAAIPDEAEFATKTDLARVMLARALDAGVPACWVTADEAYGQDYKFRSWLEGRRVGYVVAVPCSQTVPGSTGTSRADVLAAQPRPRRGSAAAAARVPRGPACSTGQPLRCPAMRTPPHRAGRGGCWCAAR